MNKIVHLVSVCLFIHFIGFFSIIQAQTAIRFNPESVEEISIPNIELSESFTIEAMVYLEGSYTAQDTLSIVNFGGKRILGISGNGYLHLGTVGRSTSTVTARRWLHISVSYDNTTKETQFYIEGQKRGTISDTELLSNGIGAVLGAAEDTLDFIGGVDDLRIWNTVRSHAQVLTNIENCYLEPISGLLALYAFDEGSGTSLIDSSGNGYNGTIISGADAVQQWVPQNRCFSGLSNTPCSDGIDNDGDGLIDCEDNSECTSGDAIDGCSRCGDGTSFADEVISFAPTCLDRLAPADCLASNTLGVPDGRFTSLGEGGSIKLKFTDNFLTNSGDEDEDLFVFEIGAIEASAISFRPANEFTQAQVDNLNIPDENGDGYYEFGRIGGATQGVDIDQLIPGYRRGQLKFDAIEVADFPENSCSFSGSPGADINAVCALSSLRITAPDLTVRNIDFDVTTIGPGGELTSSWFIENLGSLQARGGWTEEAYLVVDGGEERYFLGKTAYFDVLEGNFDVKRENSYQLPEVLGINGTCKIEIQITPNNQIAEGDNGTANNTVQSEKTLEVAKVLKVNVSKTEIAKTAQDSLEISLQRSGITTLAQEFSITSSQNTFFDLPKIVTIPEGQETVVSHINLAPDIPSIEDQAIALSITGASYPEATANFTLLANEKFDLALTYDPYFENAPNGVINFTLTTKGDASQERSVSLQSSLLDRIILPETITVLAGATETTFQGVISTSSGSTNVQKIRVTASGMEETSSTTEVTLNPSNITDFELIATSTTLSEGDGSQATQISLRRSTFLDREMQVQLRSNSSNTLTFPRTLVLDANEEELTVSIGVLENTIVEGTRAIDLTAYLVFDSCDCVNPELEEAQNTLGLTLLDNDGPSLAFDTETKVLSTTKTTAEITITRPSTSPQDLELPLPITLTSADPSLVTVPTTAVIPAGATTG